MNILTRYIAQFVLLATGLVLIILIGVESFIEFLGQLPDLSVAHYGILQAIFFVLLQIPADVYQFFPVACLLGSLIGLGWLASSNELLIVRASGYSVMRVTMAVVAAAMVMLLIVTIIGEMVAPPLVSFAETKKAEAMQRLTGVQALQGVWLYHGDDFIHVDQINSETSQTGILVYDFIGTKLQRIISAKKGVAQERFWDLQQVSELDFTGKKIQQRYLGHVNINMVFNPNLLQIGQVDPTQESMWVLYQNIKYRMRAGLNSSQLEFAFWERFFRPITVLVMICLGIPFVFGSLRDATMGSRVLTGIILGFGFYSMNQFFGPFSLIYPVPPLLAAVLPTILFAAIGVFLLLRTK
ncbi:MAG: LPS export ABC transporter permease LptG [Gammaproteobacteria bacterium RIFCSPHIGHO2_12_FULL_41_15]|nr:MAG: LPS export ABC transporter permease LptG [Gammaproteobacteria bacterium RIFCSPHIGHO2_12_FULL_41_15]